MQESLRSELGELLGRWTTREKERYRRLAWRTRPPEFRALVSTGGQVVGQVSTFLIATEPECRLFGFGDLVVREDHRGRGLARMVMLASIDRCRRQGAEVMLADTVAVRANLMRQGFRPVPRFAMFYETETACHWHPNWWCWGRHEEAGRIRLVEGDF